MAADLAIKEMCRVATTGNITLSGLQTIDGVSLSAGNRALVRAQSSAVDNGIYVVASGAWSRAADFDGTGEAAGGTQVFVTSGTRFADSAWRVAGEGAITFGSSAIAFEPEFLQTGAGAVPRTLQGKARERIDATDNGAPANGTTNAYTELASALADHAGREVRFSGAFLTRSQIEPQAGTSIVGEGPATIVRTDTASNHIFYVDGPNVGFHNLSIAGVDGSDVTNNSAIILHTADAAHVAIDRVHASGMSGWGIHAGGGANHAILSRLNVTGLSDDHQNSANVNFYSDSHRHTADRNFLEGGGGTEVGILCQINSTRHKLLFNRISNFTTYGMLDYDEPRSTYTLMLGNSVENIEGSTLGNSSGAGIYLADTGGQIIAFNHVTNSNIETDDESLAPAGIGINGSPSPLGLFGNYLHANNWYGALLVNGDEIVSFVGNVFHENLKDQLYVKLADHALLVGNSVTALSASQTQERAISVNIVAQSDKRGLLAVGNRTRGGFYRAVDIARTDLSVFAGFNVSDTSALGLVYVDSEGAVVREGVIDVTDGSTIALYLGDVTYSTLGGLVIKCDATTAISINGTCTGTRLDKSIIIVGQANPMDLIANDGTGCIVETWGTRAPVALKHQRGDTVWNSAPGTGQPIGWKCTVTGTPGTWAAMPNL